MIMVQAQATCLEESGEQGPTQTITSKGEVTLNIVLTLRS